MKLVFALLCAPALSFTRETAIGLRDDISELLSTAQDGDEFTLASGRHFPKRTIEIKAKNIIIKGDNSIISGGMVVPANLWKVSTERKGLWEADVSGERFHSISSRQLYVNGNRCFRGAASSSTVVALQDTKTQKSFGYSLSLSDAKKIGIATWGNDTEFIYRNPQWSESRCKVDYVTESESDFHINIMQPCYLIIGHKPCGQGSTTPFRIENTGILGELLESQFYLNRKSGTLYFYSETINPRQAEVISPILEVVFSVVNTTNVSLIGTTFEHGAYNTPSGATGFVEQVCYCHSSRCIGFIKM